MAPRPVAEDDDYICSFCQRGQCGRCHDGHCACCSGIDPEAL